MPRRARTPARAVSWPNPNGRPDSARRAGRQRCDCAPTRSSSRCTTCCTVSTPASSTTSLSAAVPSSPRQAYLARLLGYPEPTYAHVALVLNEDGARLAKRDGAVTLAEIGVQRAFAQIAESLGLQASNLDEMLAQFDP